MKVTKTKIPEIKVIDLDVIEDKRGFFMESYSKRDFEKYGIDADFVQDNVSYNRKKGTLRGIHFQNEPMAQAKLITCTKGKVVDIAVDIRKGSPTYKQWVAIELDAKKKRQVFIPKGFAHAYLTLTDDVEFQYKVDNFYSAECDRKVRYDDPEINIDWASLLQGIEPILSERDLKGVTLENSGCNFEYKGEK